MANEIRILEGNGRGEFSVLFLYAIGNPKTYVAAEGGASKAVTPTPSASLQGIARDLLTNAEIAALDAGTLTFEIINYGPDSAKTGAQNASDLKELYAARKAAATARYVDAYRHVGTLISAV